MAGSRANLSPVTHGGTGTTKSAFWRVSQIDGRLRRGETVTAPRLAAALEVSVRTIYRDIDYMRDQLGAPVEYDPIDQTYRYTEPTYTLPAVPLTEGELVALFLAQRVLADYAGTPYEADLTRAFGKLVDRLPDQVTVRLDGLDASLSARTTSVTPHELDTFQTLARAVQDQTTLRIRYAAASNEGDVTERRIDPYHLTNINGGWYLLAHCHLRDDIRMFRPSRIRTLAETGDRFQRPANFRPAEHLGGALAVHRGENTPHTVVLEFDAVAAPFIAERRWHASQQLDEQPDGSLHLTLKLGSLVEIRKLALSWGAHCRAIAPPALVDDLRETTQAMAAHYA